MLVLNNRALDSVHSVIFLLVGLTLASVAVRSALEPSLYSQMLYLIDEQKADPRITDANGLDTLHHLASSSVRKSEYNKRVSSCLNFL